MKRYLWRTGLLFTALLVFSLHAWGQNQRELILNNVVGKYTFEELKVADVVTPIASPNKVENGKKVTLKIKVEEAGRNVGTVTVCKKGTAEPVVEFDRDNFDKDTQEYTFYMPDQDVSVLVTLTKTLTWENVANEYTFTSFKVNSLDEDEGVTSPYQAAVGAYVTFFVEVKNDKKEIDKVEACRKKANGEYESAVSVEEDYGEYTFDMPNEDIFVIVTLKNKTKTKKLILKEETGYTMTASSSEGNPLTTPCDVLYGEKIILTVNVTDNTKQVKKIDEVTYNEQGVETGKKFCTDRKKAGTENQYEIFVSEEEKEKFVLCAVLEDKILPKKFTFADKAGEYTVTAKKEGATDNLTSGVELDKDTKVILTFVPAFGKQMKTVVLKGKKTVVKDGVPTEEPVEISATPNGTSNTEWFFSMPDYDVTLEAEIEDEAKGKPVNWNIEEVKDFVTIKLYTIEKYKDSEGVDKEREVELSQGGKVEKDNKVYVEVRLRPTVTGKAVDKIEVNNTSYPLTEEADPADQNKKIWKTDFTMPNEEAVVKVVLKDVEKPKYTITWDEKRDKCEIAVKLKNGNVNVTSGTKLEEGTELKIFVTPLTFKNRVKKVTLGTFDCRLEGGYYKASISNQNAALKIELEERPTSDTKYKLYFEDKADQYTVKVTVKEDGKEEKLKSPASLLPGTDVTLTFALQGAALTEGKVLNAVKVSGVKTERIKQVDDNIWTFEMPETEATVNAEVGESQQHKLTIPNVDGATIEVTAGTENTAVKNEDKIKAGTMLKITVKPADKKEVTSLKLGNKELTLVDNRCEVAMPNREVEFEVTVADTYLLSFQKEGITFTVTANGKSVTTGSRVVEGAKLVIGIEVTDLTQESSQVKVNEEVAVPKDGKYEYTMPKKDATISVTLRKKEHPLTIVEAGMKLVVKTSEGTTVKNGNTVPNGVGLVIEIVGQYPKDKEFDKLTLDETPLQAENGKYTATMPNAPATLTLHLKAKGGDPDGNLITVTDGGATVKIMAGETEVKADTKVKEGTALVITVKAPEKKNIVSVKFNGVVLTAESDKVTYKATMPATAATLEVTTTGGDQDGNLITVTDGGATVKIMAGETEVKADTKVKEGTALVITVKAPEKKDIVSVKFNGVVLTAESDKVTYKATMPATAATLEVVLKDITAVEDALLAGVRVAPNPFTSELRLQHTGLGEASYSIFNATGLVVKTGELTGEETRIETNNLPAGIYFVRLTTSTGASRALRVVK